MKNKENLVVYGIFHDRRNLEEAVSALRVAGFRNADVSVLFPSGSSNKEFAFENATKVPEGAAIGAASGLALGGVLGWLAGVGSLAIPGVGPLIAAGPIMAALAGAGVGTTTGGLVGSLIGMGLPEYEAKRYDGQIKKGGMLLSVHADDTEWRNRAEEILESTGATDISSETESKGDTNTSQKPYNMAGNQ